jgi:hypothetical protein
VLDERGSVADLRIGLVAASGAGARRLWIAVTGPPAAEQRYRAALLEHLAADDVQARYATSEGLCFEHLGRALEAAGSTARFLRQDMVRRLDRQLAELDEYIRKHDYRFRHEGLDAEREAPRQAVRRVVGNNSADPDAWEGRARPGRGPRNTAPSVSEGAADQGQPHPPLSS